MAGYDQPVEYKKAEGLMCTINIIHFSISLLFLLLNFTLTTFMDSPSEPNGDDRSQNDINRNNHLTSSSIGSSNFIGKHRLAAIISQQNLQIQIIQEELDVLETVGESSLVCEQLISSVESSTDALLPVTRGPADGGWDRWFQRANQSSSRNRKRWI